LARRRRIALRCECCSAEFEAGGRSGKRREARFCSWQCERKSRFRTGATAKVLEPVDAAYLAGLIDGEGSIMLTKRKTNVALTLTITNTVKSVLEWVIEIAGVGSIQEKNQYSPLHKKGWTFSVHSQAASSLLLQLRPYLKIKTSQADLAMSFFDRLCIPQLKADRVWQSDWRMQMKTLNQRGVQHELTCTAGG